MKAAHAASGGEGLEPGQFLAALHQAAGLGHQSRVPRGRRLLPWLTAAARPVAGPFGGVAARVEADVLPPRPARRAGRPAIDARAAHRVVEKPVRAGIAAQHCRPARLIGGEKCPLPVFVLAMTSSFRPRLTIVLSGRSSPKAAADAPRFLPAKPRGAIQAGPAEPAGYSRSGARPACQARVMGSMMRQASSASSQRMASVQSPRSASSSKRL